MVNTSGANGHDNGQRPSDEVLAAALQEFALKSYSTDNKLAYLFRNCGYKISKPTLMRLQAEFNTSTSRRNPTDLPVVIAAVSELIDADIHMRNGPDTVQRQLRLQDHVIASRGTVRNVMKTLAPEGAAYRRPGNQRKKIVRGSLTAAGVMEEIHCDGHEKLSSVSLRIGPVGMGIYCATEHASHEILHLVTMPSARDSNAVGHFYCDLVESLQGINHPTHGRTALQVTVDGGAEVGEMRAMHLALREQLDHTLSPQDANHVPWVAVKSTKNISVESIWKQWLQNAGRNVRTTIINGAHNGYFNGLDRYHVFLFQWLWPQIVQVHLDNFKEFWNTKRTRSQKQKLLPSGVSPQHIFDFPHEFNLRQMGLDVPLGMVEVLRNTIPCSRDEAFQWVPIAYDAAASEVYQAIGSPRLHMNTGWEIFATMEPPLRAIVAVEQFE